MKKKKNAIDSLPELPVELFEASAKLNYSELEPVITTEPFKVVRKKPKAAALGPSRSNYTVKTHGVWISYPHVVCYPFPDLVATDRVNMENTAPRLAPHERDLSKIAEANRYYKLTRFRGSVLDSPYGCRVHYGPFLAIVTQTESCREGEADFWELKSWTPAMTLTWYGEWEDVPTVPNLTIFMGSLGLGSSVSKCCTGYTWCPTTGSCLSNQLNCMDNIPI